MVFGPGWLLTGVVQDGNDGADGSLDAELRHATACLHTECVVDARLQLGDHHAGVRQLRLEADVIAARFAGRPQIVTDLTRHVVGQV